jgi:hypothetical protein
MNEDIKDLEIFSAEEKRKEHKIRWLEQLQRINTGRKPEQRCMYR